MDLTGCEIRLEDATETADVWTEASLWWKQQPASRSARQENLVQVVPGSVGGAAGDPSAQERV